MEKIIGIYEYNYKKLPIKKSLKKERNKKMKKYVFNKERFIENMFILGVIIATNIFLYYFMNNLEYFITTI